VTDEIKIKAYAETLLKASLDSTMWPELAPLAGACAMGILDTLKNQPPTTREKQLADALRDADLAIKNLMCNYTCRHCDNYGEYEYEDEDGSEWLCEKHKEKHFYAYGGRKDESIGDYMRTIKHIDQALKLFGVTDEGNL